MFVATGEGCTCSPRKIGFGLQTQPAQIPIALPEPGDPPLNRPRPGPNSRRMSTYAKCAANPRGNAHLRNPWKVSCNEHLQKMGVGEVLLLPNGHFVRRRVDRVKAHACVFAPVLDTRRQTGVRVICVEGPSSITQRQSELIHRHPQKGPDTHLVGGTT
jgi:hypothetical protein